MAGGIPALKEWIVNLDKDMVQVPFPDGFRGPDTSFEGFLKALAAQGVKPEQVAGVMTETYQGGNASFAPPEYMQKLRAWCDAHRALLIFDEVQAGFGRTGTYWGFEHYGVVPDLICCGKGISSGLPISAVIGRNDVMDLYPPGAMTSTHTGNPICAAAVLANLQVIEEERLVEHARPAGRGSSSPSCGESASGSPGTIGAVHGKGLVAALHMVKPGGIEPDAPWPRPSSAGRSKRAADAFRPGGLRRGVGEDLPAAGDCRRSVARRDCRARRGPRRRLLIRNETHPARQRPSRRRAKSVVSSAAG